MSTVVSVAAVRLHRVTTGYVVCSNISALCMATATVGVGGMASQHQACVAAGLHGYIVNVTSELSKPKDVIKTWGNALRGVR